MLGLPQIDSVTVVDQCVSDFTLNWTSADYNRACGSISYAVDLIETSSSNNSSPAESDKRNFSVNSNYMNFTRLNSNTVYMVRVKSILMGKIGEFVDKRVHTVNISSAHPSSKLIYFNAFMIM